MDDFPTAIAPLLETGNDAGDDPNEIMIDFRRTSGLVMVVPLLLYYFSYLNFLISLIL